MARETSETRFKVATDRPPPADDAFYREEIQLALRNPGTPLEALRYPITPTGMHYLLTHFDIPYVEAANWSLSVRGLVQRPLSVSWSEIKALPSRTLTVTLECAGNGRALMRPRPISQPWLLEAVGTAEWKGAPLHTVLQKAGVSPIAIEAVFTGLDQGIQGNEVQYYQRSLSIAEAMREEVLLAYEMNGEALPPQHGYPLRLIVPGWYGMTSVKWLESIEFVEQPFGGFQMLNSYRYSQTKEDPGLPVDLIRVKALMIPPGISDFLTRGRLVKRGSTLLRGRAWAGRVRVSRVEVSADSGRTWAEASLEEPVSEFAWLGWSFPWQAEPGRYELRVRATDANGATQPDDEWNYHGMGNNMVQRVEVLVED